MSKRKIYRFIGRLELGDTVRVEIKDAHRYVDGLHKHIIHRVGTVYQLPDEDDEQCRYLIGFEPPTPPLWSHDFPRRAWWLPDADLVLEKRLETIDDLQRRLLTNAEKRRLSALVDDMCAAIAKAKGE